MFKYINSPLLIALFLSVIAVAQEEQSEVRETLTVVKSYNPELEPSKKQPLLPKKPNFNRQTEAKLSYELPTFPVLETFIPKFAAPFLRWVSPVETGFSNAIHLAAGTNSIVNFDLNHRNYVNANFNYGLKASYDRLSGSLDSNYYQAFNENFSIGSILDFSTSNGSASVHLNYDNQGFNFYGLKNEIGLSVSDKSVRQRYERARLDAIYKFDTGAIKQLSLDLNQIADLTQSKELSFKAATNADFELVQNHFLIAAHVAYVSGGFQNAPLTEKINTTPQAYQFVELDFTPQLMLNKEKLSVVLGLDFDYVKQEGVSDVNLGIYPAIDANYQLSNEVVLKGGLNGETDLNSFDEFTKLNPYLSPTLTIKPSQTLYDFNLGLEANSGKYLSLEVWANASKVKNRPLMMLNHQNYYRADSGPYLNGNLNSFYTVYDDIKEMRISGQLLIRPVDHINLKAAISYSNYETTLEDEAWNLPPVRAAASLNAKLSDRWTLSSEVNYVGSRKDRQYSIVEFITEGSYPSVNYELGAFATINAALYYNYSKSWRFELKAENLTNSNFQYWYNYPDLGAKVTLGAQYGFDL